MLKLVLCIAVVVLVRCQGQLLRPLGSCLGNCRHCDKNNLESCTGVPGSVCSLGYSQDVSTKKCEPDKSHRDEIKELSEFEQVPVLTGWSLQKNLICEYPGDQNKSKNINVLGFFREDLALQKSFAIKSYHRSAIVSFNLIRNAWQPFNDYLMIALETNNKVLSRKEVSVDTRQTLMHELFKCQNKSYKVQKYQLETVLGEHRDTQLTLSFEGLMSSNSVWGVTNIHLLIGCSNFVAPDQQGECKTCQPGFYHVTSTFNYIVKCQRCPGVCLECKSVDVCTKCVEGMQAYNNRCYFMPKYNKTSIKLPGSLLCDSKSYISSKNGIIAFGKVTLPQHTHIAFSFNLFYDPNQWTEQTELYIFINREYVHRIGRDEFESYTTGQCISFKSGVFQHQKIVTPYLSNNTAAVSLGLLAMKDGKNIDFGMNAEGLHFLHYLCCEHCVECNRDDHECLKCKQGYQIKDKICILEPPQPKQQPKPKQESKPVQQPKPKQEPKPVQETKPKQQPKQEPKEEPKKQQPKQEPKEEPKKQQPKQEPKEEPKKQQPEKKPEQKPQEPAKQPQKTQQQEKQPQPKPQSQPQPKKQSQPQSKSQPKPQPKSQSQQQSKGVEPVKGSKDQNMPRQSENNPHKQDFEQKAAQTPKNSTQEQPPVFDQSTAEAQGSIQMQFHPINYVDCNDTGIHMLLKYPPNYQIRDFKATVDKIPGEWLSVKNVNVRGGVESLTILINESIKNATIGLFSNSRFINNSLLQSGKKGSRILQENGDEMILIKKQRIYRYDYVAPEKALQIVSLGYIFLFVAWISILGVSISVPLSLGIIWEQLILSAQLIFLHTYIYSEYLPLNLKEPLSFAQRIQNLDYFLKGDAQSIEQWLLGNTMQESPLRLTQFNKDINFTRGAYPILFADCFFIVWFILLLIIAKSLHKIKYKTMWQEKLEKMVVKISNRKVNYFDQLWRYQFVSLFWLCLIQFYNVYYPVDADRSGVLNGFLCFTILLAIMVWPVFVVLYTMRQKQQLEIIQFKDYFAGTYFGIMSTKQMPPLCTSIYLVIRYFKYAFYVLAASWLGNYPLAGLLPSVLLQIFQIFYVLYFQTFTDKASLLFRMAQNLGFVIIGILMLTLYGISDIGDQQLYFQIGYTTYAVMIATISVSILRALYIFYDRVGKKCRGDKSDSEKQIYCENPIETGRYL